MLTKSAISLACLLAFVTGSEISSLPNAVLVQGRATANVSHNLIVGTRVWGDYILTQQAINKSSSWLQIVTQEVTFYTPRNQTITYLRALDQKTNGNGAYASITNGGPGNRNVTLRFKSQRSHSINFILEIYGR